MMNKYILRKNTIDIITERNNVPNRYVVIHRNNISGITYQKSNEQSTATKTVYIIAIYLITHLSTDDDVFCMYCDDYLPIIKWFDGDFVPEPIPTTETAESSSHINVAALTAMGLY